MFIIPAEAPFHPSTLQHFPLLLQISRESVRRSEAFGMDRSSSSGAGDDDDDGDGGSGRRRHHHRGRHRHFHYHPHGHHHC
uniref:Bm648 n=1 Tax=Brugia malayi TaxID=6279 RepID=A0A0H5SPC6_BRUMA|nr:Bm648 [Brugia malayi]